MSEIRIYREILARNDLKAADNRKSIGNAFCINIMSSPGAGKTTMLEKTLRKLGKEYLIGIIEGDMATSNDARRLRRYARPGTVHQIRTENYGGGCHLDAAMVSAGLKKINAHEKKYDAVIIENIGNLICPADFNLGEHVKAVMLSVAEGDDKPLKYPVIFRAADLVIISKTDLAKHTKFSIRKAVANVKKVNSKARIIEISSVDNSNFCKWTDYLRSCMDSRRI
jgi:hydrogenase nickel incorporation protein HypB